MTTVWCVTLPDTEKNFPRKVDAVAFLRRCTNDERIRPVVVRHCRGSYTFYGPGRDAVVLRAHIDHLGFASLGRRRR